MSEENIEINRKKITSWNHPNSNANGTIFEYRLLASKALGKSLPEGSVVHHHSYNQLVLCQDTSYHHILHKRQKAYNATGDPNKRKCTVCKEWDLISNMILQFKGEYEHRRCHNKRVCLLRHKKYGVPNKSRRFLCSILNCDNIHRARGFCKHHYDKIILRGCKNV